MMMSSKTRMETSMSESLTRLERAPVKSNEELENLILESLQDLNFHEKIVLVELLGLVPAYCTECWCTLGSPVCHPLPESITADNDPQTTGCPSLCPTAERNAERDEED